MRAALLLVLLAMFSGLGEAAEGEPRKGRVFLRETGPNRLADHKLPGSFHAFREVVRGGKTSYFGRLGYVTLTAADLAAMMKLAEEVKGKTTAKDIAQATVIFQATDPKSHTEVTFSYSLEDGSWKWPSGHPGGPRVTYPAALYEQVHKDIEAMKAVKPSLDW